MIPFAVSIEGITEEGRALWVLAVDPIGERLLIAYEDRTFHWHPMAECSFAKLRDPEGAQLVVPVQPKPQNGMIAVPNRVMRREMERDGR